MVTPRANLLSVFRHEMPEWIAIVGRVDPYNQPNREGMDPGLAEQLEEVKWRDESTLAFSRYLGIDVMDHFIMHVTAFPDKTMEQTQFIVDQCRKYQDLFKKRTR